MISKIDIGAVSIKSHNVSNNKSSEIKNNIKNKENDKLESIKKNILNGNYKIDIEKTAEKIAQTLV